MSRLTVVISQGQSASPEKRKLEEDLVGALLFEAGIEVAVIPHLYDLTADGTGMLCLRGITGDMVVLSWLFPRAAHWTFDRNGIKGHFGQTLLKGAADEDEEEEEDDAQADDSAEDDERANDKSRVGGRDLPNRTIYHLDLRAADRPEQFVAEIKRIAAEAAIQTVGLLGAFNAAPGVASATASPLPLSLPGRGRERVGSDNGDGDDNHSVGSAPPQPTFDPALIIQPGGPLRIEETPQRRWYPVIDYSRCTNCMECIDFCLFGVYGVDRAETILVEQPDNCRKGCPACSRVCPENAIIFPQHKTPAIAGSPDGVAGGLKIDLSLLFGAPNAIEIAAQERDVELVAVGRDAVGVSVGIPKRQADKPAGPKDDLDKLMDQLDELGL